MAAWHAAAEALKCMQPSVYCAKLYLLQLLQPKLHSQLLFISMHIACDRD